MNQARFQEQQREKARREQAQAKPARREERGNARDEPLPTSVAPVDQAEVLAELADLHARLESGAIDHGDVVTATDKRAPRLRIE